MAFQGSLNDFSVTEVLQLLGTQKKNGCLMLEWNSARASFYVVDGKMVATRDPGMSPEDPLLRFLIKARRLSNEQYRGIMTIQRESKRDLEDLLVNGRYLDAEELGALIERQMLDDLMRVMTWQTGSYRFDPAVRWPNPPLARLSVEAALIEVARRVDEQRRFAELRQDPLKLMGVRDLPDAEEHLTEEECELFGIIDGTKTVGEILEAAPMSEYEALEAVHRMLEAGWVEFTGRRDVAAAPPTAAPVAAAEDGESEGRERLALGRDLAMALVAVTLGLVLALAGRTLRAPAPTASTVDVFQSAAQRDVRLALDLYHRERGRYPQKLDELVAERWIDSERTRLAGASLRYTVDLGLDTYTLESGQPKN